MRLRRRQRARGERPATLARLCAWKLEEAEARFSEVVRLARTVAPQRVTVDGEDAVVILSAEDFARLAPAAEQPKLHALLSNSPLKNLVFGEEGVRAPVREVEF